MDGFLQTRCPIGVIAGSSVMAGKNVVIDPFAAAAAAAAAEGIMLRNGGSGGTKPLGILPLDGVAVPVLGWPFACNEKNKHTQNY